MQTLLQDLRYGARALIRTPGFTLVAILMLALGIGANTAIFSVVNAALLRPLGFKQPEQLVMVFSKTSGEARGSVSIPDLVDWRAQSQSFSQLSAVTPQSVNLTGRAEPGRVIGGFVSSDFFKTLGVEPALGRAFLSGEDQAGAERVAIVNPVVWRDRFGADPGLVGQTLTLNGQLFTVVGIMPEGFRFPYSDIDVWIPVQYHPGFSLDRKSAAVEVIGRLKPGVSERQAQAEMDTIAARLAQQYPEANKDRGVTLVNLQAMVVERVQPLLLALLGAVGFVLLIACANVANLMLSRAVGRSKELALRAALGASRFRLVQQLLTESLMLSLAGGLVGLLIGIWGMDALAASSGIALPFGVQVKLDPVVFGFTFGVTVLTGVLFGLLPALRFSRPDLNDALKEGGRSSGANLGRSRLRSALVVTQIVLAIVLLTGAGLMARSFVNYLRVDPGFDSKNLLTLEYRVPRNKYPEPKQQQQFHEEVVARVQALPGVQSAALVMSVPHGAGIGESGFVLPDRPAPPEGQEPRAQVNRTDANYFRTMRIPLLKGRTFSAQDQPDTPRAMVINQTMARHFWPNEDPIGKQVQLLGSDVKATIIGVVGDIKHGSLDERESAQIYLAYSQRPDIFGSLVVRTSGDALSFSKAVRDAIWSIDKDQPVWKVRTMEFLLDRSLGGQRFMVQLLGIFSLLALLLASVGIYGVMSYAVSQRTNEIGIRMALGAQAGDVLRMIMRQGMTLTLIGIAIGMMATFGLMRLTGLLLVNQLFGVSATDPLTFLAIGLLLTLTALLACYLPARRATTVDPMIALRCE